MKAAFITAPCPADGIQFGDLPQPQPRAVEALVRVRAVAVNPIDTYVRAGMVKMALPSPFIIGCDFAGVVEAVGVECKSFQPGDRVWGSNQGLFGRQGCFAELACVDEKWLNPVPTSVRDEDAAAVALVGITAHLGLFAKARLQAGETVFVNGGAGGVGSMVVQMAKAAGARVIATAGSDERVAKARGFGADLVLNHRTQAVAAAVKEFAPGGVNVFWETQREPDFDQAVPLLAPRGRFVLMAGREARPVFPVGPFYVKDCSLHGFAMFNATPDEQRACAADLNRWLAAGRLRANIDRLLPLDRAAAAHRLQEENTLHKSGALAGKIVLKP
ncbi:MAG: NADPH:quinone reductase [Verrucomicrobia bacterium]|nr:NADPH:quinone reductase [Verrucomicrobiota bacterium]